MLDAFTDIISLVSSEMTLVGKRMMEGKHPCFCMSENICPVKPVISFFLNVNFEANRWIQSCYLEPHPSLLSVKNKLYQHIPPQNRFI